MNRPIDDDDSSLVIGRGPRSSAAPALDLTTYRWTGSFCNTRFTRQQGSCHGHARRLGACWLRLDVIYVGDFVLL